jgi:branched-subunit amino acid aminotransferase/4-amino-4-deoxychorismate lyase
LAEIEAKSVDPDAYGLMLDLKGCLAECVRQNIFLVKNGKLLTPTRNNILEGVSRKATLALAQQLGMETQETNLFVYDLYNADEIFVTATSFAILPVSKVNSQSLEKNVPGPVTKQLQSAWSKMVGVDFVRQAFKKAQIKGPNS